MTSTLPSSDGSLYELVLQSKLPSTALQVSPSTLKSLTDSLVHLLIDHEIPAIVWAKLPRGEVWWVAIEQYINLPGLARSVYLFTQQRDESDESGSGAGTQLDQDVAGEMPNQTTTPVITVQLPPESLLRREYFVMVWSARFKAGLFAHRPRSIQVNPTPDSTPLSFDLLADTYGQLPQLLDSTQERRQLLLALCSYEAEIVEQGIRGLERAIATLSLHLTGHSASVPTLDCAALASSLVQHWQPLWQQIPATPSSLFIVEQLLSRHIQHQEDLWQRSSLFRKQAEQAEQLRLQNEEMSTMLRLKNDFLNNVGQELRTPLTTIKTALTLLNATTMKQQQRQRYMDLIAKECDRQNTLITSLLDLAQLDQVSGQATLPPIRIIDTVPGVVSTYQPIAQEKGVQLSYSIPDDLPPIACMTNWLKQIVIHLLQNALKYTPSGGSVRIRARRQDDCIQLEVRDTGIGIAHSEIPRIFDRFYRVRQSGDESSGAGLGLTIVQQLLLHCGGSISVKSKVDEGSVFTVQLPVYKNPSSQS